MRFKRKRFTCNPIIRSHFTGAAERGSTNRGFFLVSNASNRQGKRVRFAPIAIGTGALAAVLLSLTMSGTLAGFTASINNNTNTAASGSLVMQEQNAGATVTCLSTDLGSVSTNASTCSTINKFGGSTTMVPGQLVTTTVTIKNVGSAPASTFTLTPGATCAQTNNGALNGTAVDPALSLSPGTLRSCFPKRRACAINAGDSPPWD